MRPLPPFPLNFPALHLFTVLSSRCLSGHVLLGCKLSTLKHARWQCCVAPVAGLGARRCHLAHETGQASSKSCCSLRHLVNLLLHQTSLHGGGGSLTMLQRCNVPHAWRQNCV